MRFALVLFSVVSTLLTASLAHAGRVNGECMRAYAQKGESTTTASIMCANVNHADSSCMTAYVAANESITTASIMCH